MLNNEKTQNWPKKDSNLRYVRQRQPSCEEIDPPDKLESICYEARKVIGLGPITDKEVAWFMGGQNRWQMA